jgi:hypothetical protein
VREYRLQLSPPVGASDIIFFLPLRYASSNVHTYPANARVRESGSESAPLVPVVAKQFRLTYDLDSMQPDAIVALLPREIVSGTGDLLLKRSADHSELEEPDMNRALEPIRYDRRADEGVRRRGPAAASRTLPLFRLRDPAPPAGSVSPRTAVKARPAPLARRRIPTGPCVILVGP